MAMIYLVLIEIPTWYLGIELAFISITYTV